jgi:perosamine synthetase
MKNIIQLNIPNLKGNEKRYIQNCIITNWISTSGKYIGKFEKKLCEFTKSKNAIACINGTAALQISLKIVGVKNEDEVIVPTLTFIAPVNAIKYNNAIPVFMDADQTHNLDINKTIDFIKNNTFFKKRFSYNKKSKRRISALIPVHVWGNAVNLEKLIS